MKKMKIGFLMMVFGVIFALTGTGVYAADLYKVDPVHSSLGFEVTHLMVSKVRGEFAKFEGTIAYDAKDPAAFSAEATVQTDSIDTRVAQRDEHLRSPDFFDVAKYPTITFKSKSLTKNGDKLTMVGDLTMKGVTKEVSIPVDIAGPVKGPMGKTVIGLTGLVTINRQDYGIAWNKTLDNGGYVVSDDVVINVNLEADQQEAAPAAQPAK